MTDTQTNPTTRTPTDTPPAFMQRVAQVLSDARQKTLFKDLTRAATELLGADIAFLGRYVEKEGIPSVSTLACYAEGQFTPDRTYPLSSASCEGANDQPIRDFPKDLAVLFPESELMHQAVGGSTACPLLDNDGQQIGVFTVLSYQPLLDNERAESLLAIFSARAVAEIERNELEGQLRQAQKMEAIGQLTSGVAHGFNNILASVLGYVELALEHVEEINDEDLNYFLDRARRSGESARDLIQKMLSFSREQDSEARAMDIGPIVSDAVTMLESIVSSTINISREIPSDLPLVTQDPVRLEQVLINLCINARDAMVDGGALGISLAQVHCDQEVCSSCHVEPSGDFVELTVTDDGIGMSPDLISKIFDPFLSTKEAGRSSGIGLSTVHGIVHEYGGHVVVKSVLDEGTTIRVLLPIAISQPTELAVGAGDESTGPSLHGNVLLVDNNTDVAEFVADLLGEWGLNVAVFSDPEAAMKHFREHADTYAIAILDQTMPTNMGIELAGLMSRHRSGFPIVLYTDQSDSVNDDTASKAGICRIWRKPFDFDHLRSSIEQILGAPDISGLGAGLSRGEHETSTDPNVTN